MFHRDGVGDIDLVWGDKGGGFEHIVSKHIGEGKSFSTVDEAAQVIDDIIKTGTKDFENGDKIVFKKGSKLVTIRKNVRDKGKKIADKNWVLTAYDELSADGDVSAIAPVNQGQAAPTTDKSRGKDTDKSETSNNQEVNSERNNVSETPEKKETTNAGKGTKSGKKKESKAKDDSTEKIEDVGEKIGGAKKDIYKRTMERVKKDLDQSNEDLMSFIASTPLSKKTRRTKAIIFH